VLVQKEYVLQRHARRVALPRLETRQLILSMKTPEENMVWLQEHFQDLLTTYADRWVAVHEERVVASDTDHERLLSKLRSDANFNVYAVQLITAETIDLVL